MKKIYPLLILAFFASPLRADTAADFLMGSVVKSDKWKMDRVKNRETFDGNVSFRNAAYNLKTDYAVYDRKPRLWTLKGSVYCLRKFKDGSSIELRCERGDYSEAMEKASLYRGAESIKIKYLDPLGKALRGSCDRINAQESAASIDFIGNFRLATENMRIFSDYGFYDNKEQSFLLHGSTAAVPQPPGKARLSPKPLALGDREGYDFALTGEKIKFLKDTGEVKLYNDVAGWVKAGKTR
ncbi:MAG: hypothetical protein HY796_06580 [Elusimicrobia bacterium]|nr:hypothetical protein [Elusimicrobiota bacterium]